MDALGNLVRFVLMPANRYDTVGVAPLIEGVELEAMLADKAFDSNWIIDDLNERGAKVFSPSVWWVGSETSSIKTRVRA